MKWCVECGAVGKPEPAVTAHEGDPLCAGCAKARGTVFNAEFIDRKMAEHKALQQEPSAPKEKAMSTEVSGATCGCGRPQIHKGRCAYRRNGGGTTVEPKPARKQGHSALRFNKATNAIEKFDPHPATAAVPEALDVLPVDLLWNALPTAHKKQALRALLDSIL